MPRPRAQTTGRFATRAELEAEMDRMGDAGAFDSEIARATGVSSAHVAQYLRTRPKRRKPRPAPAEPEPITAPAPEFEFPLVAAGLDVLTAAGRRVASGVTAEVAIEIAGAMNLMHPSCPDAFVREAARGLVSVLAAFSNAKTAAAEHDPVSSGSRPRQAAKRRPAA